MALVSPHARRAEKALLSARRARQAVPLRNLPHRNYGLVIFKFETITSVLCAKRRPYTPSVDFSLPSVTSVALSYVPTTVPLIEQMTEFPFTDSATSCDTGEPGPAALCTAAFASPARPFN